MELNELMIGDLVSYKGKMSCKITAICKDTAVVDNSTEQDWRIDYNKLIPIPLTTEVLEKIGFIKHADYCWLISENNGKRLIEYRTDYLDGLLRISYAEEPFSKLMIKVKYVHELQHALRLCGIEKEIEL